MTNSEEKKETIRIVKAVLSDKKLTDKEAEQVATELMKYTSLID